MSKYTNMAAALVEKLGGKENILSVLHCMTRLRFQLKNYETVDLASVKAIKGVLGAQKAEGSLHVIIGTTVSDVYPEVVAAAGVEAGEQLRENLDAHKKPITLRGMGEGFVNVLSQSMTPLVPLFVALGMVNVIAALIGPDFLGLVSAESHLYTNFYYIYETILYFLPLLMAVSTAKVFKCNPMLALIAVATLLLPNVVNALAAEGGYTVFGIPAANVPYNGTVIPALLIVWILSYVEKLFQKIIPNALKVIGVSTCTLIVMLPLSLCVLGPLGNYIGTVLANLVMWLYNVAGPIEMMVVNAAVLFLTALGIVRPLFFICMNTLFTVGVEYAFMPSALVFMNFITIGIASGYLVKSKTAAKRETGLACLVSIALGGVSEPTMFGIVLPNKKTWLPIIISGAVSGLIAGFLKVGAYQMGPTNILSVLCLMSANDPNNFLYGCIVSAVAAVLAFVLMLFMYKDEDK